MRFLCFFVLMVWLSGTPRVFLAVFHPSPGADVEHAQGAIERNELRHREVETNVWVFVSDGVASAAEWEVGLNRALPDGVGRFAVRDADHELRERVVAGGMPLQQ